MRPIAQGDTDRKMNASCILASISDQAKQYFKGSQYGMESMGTEKNIHAINYLRDNVPAWDHVSLDQEKAAMVTAIKIFQLCSTIFVLTTFMPTPCFSVTVKNSPFMNSFPVKAYSRVTH